MESLILRISCKVSEALCILRVSCKVYVKPFGLHLLYKRPEVFMIPSTFQKSNSFLKLQLTSDIARFPRAFKNVTLSFDITRIIALALLARCGRIYV